MMYQKQRQLIQIIKTLLNKKEAKFENGVITRKADEKQLIIQLLTRNQVNNLKNNTFK